ncbi:glycosyltransferase family 4 protein [Lapillicoccus jejuensis]|uniref:D-inositol 3-phosphate glycosyltransferase n=1 Tax=Lapillicoccus jejuensis TaxID=402171 RepID=A0A542E1F4_9MICO|nr:glycosyltransferase family 4 protein [Lapillicoccus jejuensis]TQJ09162.1 glycosyltransferase involved in cell wall biosynthesis [Lapillicoccus jejuensis]
MKVLVHPHDLELGGSQLNAIEIAAGVRDLGHEVVVRARPGVLADRVHELGLELIEAPPIGIRPHPGEVSALRRLTRERGFDVLHGYEWPPSIDLWLASAGTSATVMSTVMSMSVAPFIPRHLPLVVGTEEIAARERASGRTTVRVVEPPVDLSVNHRGAGGDTDLFRRRVGADAHSLLVVVVCRLAHELKLEGLLAAVDVVPTLGRDVQLLVVGDGPARAQLESAAAAANARCGRRAVLLAGELMDPRPAYDAADIVLGMGGSALRALGFGKPLVVQGEKGFWRLLEADSIDTFLWTGWYGLGDGRDGRPTLRAALERLVSDRELRERLGRLGHYVCRERFSLTSAAQRQVELYQEALDSRPATFATSAREATRIGSQYVHHAMLRKWRRATGGPRDDFNVPQPAFPREPVAPRLPVPDREKAGAR